MSYITHSVYFFYCLLGLIILKINCNSAPKNNLAAENKIEATPFKAAQKINGLSFVATPKPFSAKAFVDIENVCANFIAVIPYAFTRGDDPHVSFNNNFQWWGESIAGVSATIDSAHAHNMSVMLKPQVFVGRVWIGDLTFANDSLWQIWEKDYSNYILQFAQLAADKKIALFSVGTEITKSVRLRPAFWKKFIPEIKKIYSGKLVYAANWNDYEEVTFYDQLDYIGIDAYFPLDTSKTPNVENLLQKWKPIATELEAFSKKINKPVLFTEAGYLSVDGCGGKNWELEKTRKTSPINEIAQSNAYAALLTEFQDKKYFAGVFWWKWFPDKMGHEGAMERDYTPQNKLAARVLKQFYCK